MGRKLGAKVGTVISVESQKRTSWRGGTQGMEFIRTLVEVDVRKPLVRGAILAQGDGRKRWISFRYDKLPNFCYGCGYMGHVVKDCKKPHDEQQYGDWLRSYSDSQSPPAQGVEPEQHRAPPATESPTDKDGEDRAANNAADPEETNPSMHGISIDDRYPGGIMGMGSTRDLYLHPFGLFEQLRGQLQTRDMFVFAALSGKGEGMGVHQQHGATGDNNVTKNVMIGLKPSQSDTKGGLDSVLASEVHGPLVEKDGLLH